MQLVSPSLPVGSYAYSQGLEYAIDAGWVSNEEETCNWIDAILSTSFKSTDLAIFRKCYIAWEDKDSPSVHLWNTQLIACRETKEFELEEKQLGYALKKLLMEIESDCLLDVETEWTFVALFSCVAEYWNIDLRESMLGFTHAWVENQIAAAIKLVPLGQVAGQRLMQNLQNSIESAVEESFQIADEEIGISLPGLAIASSLHETQYSRLFRS